MDPQAPSLVPEKPNFPEPPQPKDNHWITILSMAVFVLLSLAAVAFLYYQNQQLKGMLASYQTPPIPTTTADPTANWKAYTNEVMGFSVKLPPNWFIHKEEKALYGYSTNISYPVDNPSSQDFIEGQKADISIGVSDQKVRSLDERAQEQIENDKNALEAFSKSTNSNTYSPMKNKATYPGIDGEDAVVLYYGDDTGKLILVNHGKYEYSITLFNRDKIEEINKTFDQILSTFKFLGASPTPSAKACTMEAKLCPDGSYVGRTGPNCEFAACP